MLATRRNAGEAHPPAVYAGVALPPLAGVIHDRDDLTLQVNRPRRALGVGTLIAVLEAKVVAGRRRRRRKATSGGTLAGEKASADPGARLSWEDAVEVCGMGMPIGTLCCRSASSRRGWRVALFGLGFVRSADVELPM